MPLGLYTFFSAREESDSILKSCKLMYEGMYQPSMLCKLPQTQMVYGNDNDAVIFPSFRNLERKVRLVVSSGSHF